MKEAKSNKTLLKLLKKGDLIAFDVIYERYCKRLYGFVLLYIKQEADAEEIVQEIFLKLWESREKIDNSGSFEAYLFTIAYNTTISLLRKKVNEQKYLDHLKSRQNNNRDCTTLDEVHFNQLNERVNSLLNRLTPRQKEIFLLSREKGLTHREIAQKLDLSANTVKNHLVTALNYLKSHIDTALTIPLFLFLL